MVLDPENDAQNDSSEPVGARRSTPETPDGFLSEEPEQEGSEVTLDSLGVDVSELDEKSQGVVKSALARVVQHLQNQREADATRLNELEDKARRYDDAILRGGVPRETPPEKEVPITTFLDPDKLASLAADPVKFARLLEDAMEKVADKRVSRFDTERVAPLQSLADRNAQVTVMDSMYPSWRKSIPFLRKTLASEPEAGGDIQTLYERKVVIPGLVRELRKLHTVQSSARTKREEALRATPDGQESKQTETAPGVKRYANAKLAALDALMELEGKRGKETE